MIIKFTFKKKEQNLKLLISFFCKKIINVTDLALGCKSWGTCENMLYYYHTYWAPIKSLKIKSLNKLHWMKRSLSWREESKSILSNVLIRILILKFSLQTQSWAWSWNFNLLIIFNCGQEIYGQFCKSLQLV